MVSPLTKVSPSNHLALPLVKALVSPFQSICKL
jgi:hypothetical protein